MIAVEFHRLFFELLSRMLNCTGNLLQVGQAMASNESHAIEIIRELDVDYILVIFGGVVGYSSDGEMCGYSIRI